MVCSAIDDFQLEFGEDKPLRWQVNGLLEPVSLSQLSLALGWPELAGKLSGVIPNVRYDDGNSQGRRYTVDTRV